MWTRLFRLGAQSTRYDHDLDHETSPTHTKRLFIAASAFFLDLSSSSVLKISLVLSFSPLPTFLRLLRCSAPPKPPLDQERLQLIDLSCIRHPGHYTRGVLFVQPSGELCNTSSLGARQELGSPLFCLAGRRSNITVIPAGRGGCIYAKKISTCGIGWILSGIYNIGLDLETTG
jgi:hypothetical protein